MSFTWSPGDPDYLLVARIAGPIIFIWMLFSIRKLLLGLSSNNWIPINAKVEDVRIDHETDSDDDTWYKPKITYGYRLGNGRWVKSSRVSYRVLSSMNYSEAMKHVSGVKSGGNLRVYQNPKKPQQSVVFPGINFGNIFEIIVPIIMLIILLHGVHKHSEIVGL